MKELSIVIPHFNTPQLLQILIDSIPDIEDIEVLVVDDNSDKDRDIYLQCVERNSHRNIRFYANKAEMKGAGNARNIGLDNAEGKWLLFADADDYFFHGFWESLKPYLDTQADVIYFSPTSRILNSDHLSDRHVHYMKLVENYCQEKSHENELKLRYNYWSPCSKLIRREMVEKNHIRFDGTLHSNDMMFSTQIGHCAKRIEAVNKVIYCITESKNSLTAIKDNNALEIRKRVFSRYYFYLRKVLSRKDMSILGFGIKDLIYFSLYELLYFVKIK